MAIIIRGRNKLLASRLKPLFNEITGDKWRIAEHHYLTAPVSWSHNLCLALPDPRQVRGAPPTYGQMFHFYTAHKRGQWHRLREFFPTPEIVEPPYVVRPLRHEAGEGFEVSDALPDAARAATHYWRSLWRRNSEYRVIYAHSHRVVTLLKRVPENTDQKIPWSAGVSSFVTVRHEENDRLRYTDFYAKADTFLRQYPFPLIAFDLLFRAKQYAVVEVNFNPGVIIEDNFVKLAEELVAPYV